MTCTPTLCVTRSASWMRAAGFPAPSIERHLAAGEEHLASVRRAIRAGVTLVNGTDIPPGDMVDGTPAAVYELLLLAEAGLSPLLSLQSASDAAWQEQAGYSRAVRRGNIVTVSGTTAAGPDGTARPGPAGSRRPGRTARCSARSGPRTPCCTRAG